MKFKIFLLENSTNDTLKDIVKIFNNVLEEYSFEYEVKGNFNLNKNSVTIQFWRINNNRIEQDAHIELIEIDGKYDLHLSDIYIPSELQNRGYLTKVLKEVRKLPKISGRCKVHVAVNSAWKKIIERSGFEWI